MYHCGTDRDTAQHTLADCPAWAVQRRELVNVVDADLSLPVLVTRMTGSEEAWKAAVSFCEAVKLRKEAAKGSAVRRRRPKRRRLRLELQQQATETAATVRSQGEEEEGKEETGGEFNSHTPALPSSNKEK